MDKKDIYDFKLDSNFEGKERMQLYIPTRLKNKLTQMSKKKGVSRNKLGLQIIEDYLKEQTSA